MGNQCFLFGGEMKGLVDLSHLFFLDIDYPAGKGSCDMVQNLFAGRFYVFQGTLNNTR